MHRNEHVSSRSDFAVGLDQAAGDARYVRKNALQSAAGDYIRLGAAPLAIGAINIDGSSFGGVAINATGSVTAGAASFTTLAASSTATISTAQSLILKATGANSWEIGHNIYSANQFSITPSTAVNGVTFTTPLFTINAGGTGTYASNFGVTGNLTVGASTFVVTAASGNTAIGAATATARLLSQGTSIATFQSAAHSAASIALSSQGYIANDYITQDFVSADRNIVARIAARMTANGGYLMIGTTNSFTAITNTAVTVDYTGNVQLGGTLAITGALTVGTSTPHTSAQAQGDTTAKGWLFPRMTTAQKNAIGTPATGLVVFDTTLAKLCVYTGAAWETITSA